MVDGKVLNYAATFLMFTCLLFFLIGTGAPNWVTINVSGTNFGHAGLWKSCSTSTCSTIDSKCEVGGAKEGSSAQCSKLNASRAFSLISIFVSAAALGCLLLVTVKGSSNLSSPALVLGAVLVLTSLIAWAAFTGARPDLGSGVSEPYAFSFGLFVAGWVFSIIATGLIFGGRGASSA